VLVLGAIVFAVILQSAPTSGAPISMIWRRRRAIARRDSGGPATTTIFDLARSLLGISGYLIVPAGSPVPWWSRPNVPAVPVKGLHRASRGLGPPKAKKRAALPLRLTDTGTALPKGGPLLVDFLEERLWLTPV
jgi:hypothetical protein